MTPGPASPSNLILNRFFSFIPLHPHRPSVCPSNMPSWLCSWALILFPLPPRSWHVDSSSWSISAQIAPFPRSLCFPLSNVASLLLAPQSLSVTLPGLIFCYPICLFRDFSTVSLPLLNHKLHKSRDLICQIQQVSILSAWFLDTSEHSINICGMNMC